jgi:hypothetical protein
MTAAGSAHLASSKFIAAGAREGQKPRKEFDIGT